MCIKEFLISSYYINTFLKANTSIKNGDRNFRVKKVIDIIEGNIKRRYMNFIYFLFL